MLIIPGILASGWRSAGSYESIATVNGTGSAALVTFTNIPQTYKHLQLRLFARTSYAANYDQIYLYNYNNNTGNTGSATHSLYGDGASAYASGFTSQFSSAIGYVPSANLNSSIYGTAIVDILDYTNTNKNKTIRSLNGWDANGSGLVGLYSSLPLTLPGTNAITTLSVLFNGNISNASHFALYGVKG